MLHNIRGPLLIGVAGSLIAAALASLSASLISSSLVAPLAIAASVLFLTVLLALLWRRFALHYVPYMSSDALGRRVQAAKKEIWSFQISGGEFTAGSIDVYREWLMDDDSRRLKIMFADPTRRGLIKSIVKLGGMGELSASDPEAVANLQRTIAISLKLYSDLSGELPSQVDVRVYDCCPPCSVHAIDVRTNSRTGSIFVEHYLPGLAWVDRPCVVIRRAHKSFAVYADQCESWFVNANPQTAAEESPPT